MFAAVLTNLSTSIETSRPDSRAAVTLCFKDIVTKWGKEGMLKGRQAMCSYQKWGQCIVKLPKRLRQIRMVIPSLLKIGNSP